MPAWGTLIALTHRGTPVLGLVHQPFVGERFSGDGASARYRGPAGERALLVRACTSLAQAVLYTTSPRLMNAADRKRFERVAEMGRLSRYGGEFFRHFMLGARPI